MLSKVRTLVPYHSVLTAFYLPFGGSISQGTMKFFVLLLFLGLLDNGYSENISQSVGLEDQTKSMSDSVKQQVAGSRPGGRIIGGEEAGMKDAPWQVPLKVVEILHYFGNI